MSETQILSSLLRHSNTKASRSTVLKSLTWMVGICLAGLILAATSSINEWVVAVIAVILVLSFVLYAISYIFFMIKNPDALRSEKYNIQKMAVEKGIIGDNTNGVIKLDDVATLKLTPYQQRDSGK